jgi:hypothetical protein
MASPDDVADMSNSTRGMNNLGLGAAPPALPVEETTEHEAMEGAGGAVLTSYPPPQAERRFSDAEHLFAGPPPAEGEVDLR